MLPALSEAYRWGQLIGIGMGGVYEPPTVGSFSHVQLFMPVQGALNYRPLFTVLRVQTDQTAMVRIAFQDAALLTLDGVTQASDRNQSGGNIRMVARSETNVAQVAVAVDLIRLRCPADQWVDVPIVEYQSGAGGQGITMNPIVTGVGIAVYGQWRESLDLGPE